MKKLIVCLAAFTMTVSVAFAINLPSTGTGVAPGVWTKNFEGVKAAAAQTGYPIFLVVLNDGVGGTCSICKQFVNLTMKSSEFAALEKSNIPFYKVLINYGSGQGHVPNSVFQSIYKKYRKDKLPVVAVLNSSAKALVSFGTTSVYRQNLTSSIKNYLLKSTQGATHIKPIKPTPDVSVTPDPETIRDYAGNYSAVLFDDDGAISGAAQFRLNTRGTGTLRINKDGRNRSIPVKVELSSTGAKLTSTRNTSLLAESESDGGFVGTYDNDKIFIKKTNSLSGLNGTYTFAAESDTSSAINKLGYGSATVKANGSVSLSGKLGGVKKRISLTGKTIYLTAKEVRKYLRGKPAVDSLVFVASKTSNAAALVFTADGHVYGDLNFKGISFACEGMRYDYRQLDLMDFKNGELSFDNLQPVALMASRSKISTAKNSYNARISVTKKSGIFRGTYKVKGVSYKYEGVLLQDKDGVETGYGISEKSSGSNNPQGSVRVFHGDGNNSNSGSACDPGNPGSSCN